MPNPSIVVPDIIKMPNIRASASAIPAIKLPPNKNTPPKARPAMPTLVSSSFNNAQWPANGLVEIFSAIIEMPKVMWQLALVYLFQWYALFCYWQNSSKSIALSVWNATPKSNPDAYEKAVSWTGLVNGWYNIVTFLVAFLLVGFAKKYSAKYVHAACLFIAAIGF